MLSMQPVLATDQEALTSCLEGILPHCYSGECAVAGIEQSQFERPTFYGARIVTVRLSSGDRLEFFLKDFGSYSKKPKDEMELRRERELRVYRDLLAGAALGTPRYYGSLWDESRGRFWLLIELVSGTHLRHCDFEYWVRAAAWLGRLQRYFASCPERFHACTLLLRHDAAFFLSRMDTALEAVSQISVPLADRLERILAVYPAVVEVMASQPATFVHGCYTPTQILLDRDGDASRICPIDWELSALGSPLYDLASLSDGFEPPKLYQLWDAYGEQAAQHGLHVPDRDEMTRVANSFRLHRVMTWLGRSVRKAYPPNAVARLVATGERLSSTLS
jgi:hypothetical protein